MKNTIILIIFMLLTACTNKHQQKEVFSVEQAKAALDFSAKQYKLMMASLPDTVLPRTFENGINTYSDAYWWCSGFYPGSCWYLYEYTNDKTFKTEAIKRTALLKPIQFVTNNHDVGFMLYCSFGNGYRLTKNEEYKNVLINGANSLITRFRPEVGCIQSWDWAKKWQCPVIIDNMMNLELLNWASRTTENVKYADISRTHSNTTIKNHFREDFSSFHVIDYDTVTGEVLNKNTHQGYSDESAWSRGQSWGLYGYTMMYRDTKDKNYLKQAINIAEYILNHPNLPEDMIPYWDFNAPDIPNEERDASAAALMASAFLELSGYVEGKQKEKYFNSSEIILASLSSTTYLAKEGENGNFIIMHNVGAKPFDSEMDVPLTYADYYYIEALLRYVKMNEN